MVRLTAVLGVPKPSVLPQFCTSINKHAGVYDVICVKCKKWAKHRDVYTHSCLAPFKNNLIFAVLWEIKHAKHIVRSGGFYYSISSSAIFFAWQYHHRSFNSEKGRRPKRYENAINCSVLKLTMFSTCTKKLHPAIKLAVLVPRGRQAFFGLPVLAGLFVTVLLVATVPGSHQGGTLRCCLRRSWGRSWHNSPGTPQSDCGRVAFSEVPWHQDGRSPACPRLSFPSLIPWRRAARILHPLSWLLGSSSFHCSDWSKQHASTVPQAWVGRSSSELRVAAFARRAMLQGSCWRWTLVISGILLCKNGWRDKVSKRSLEIWLILTYWRWNEI